MKKRMASIMLGAALLMPAIAGCAPAANTVTVDFGTKDGTAVQNLKKFDNFSSTWAWVGEQANTIDPNVLRILPAMNEMKSENMRFDLFMGSGGVGYEIGRGVDKNATTDAEFASTMRLVEAFQQNHIVPYFSYFAAPAYCGTTWKQPDDLEKWEEICHNIAAYMKEHDVRLAAHEIWNEPDFAGTFFGGDWVEYIDTYIAGARGVRSANPDAVVAAGSFAWPHKATRDKETVKNDGEKTQFQRLIERTYDAYLPDAISWHYYGMNGQINDLPDPDHAFSTYRNSMRDALQGYQDGTHADLAEGVSYPRLETMQQHLNEFNIYQPAADAIYQSVEIVPSMFEAFDTLLSATDVTRVNWASLIAEKKTDGALGYDFIDGQSYQRYPAYHTMWMYGHLPVDRVSVDLGNSNLGSMAGVDDHRGGLIVYNKSTTEQKINVKLTNLPFETGNLEVYLVDEEHYSYTTQNAPLTVRKRENVSTEGLEVQMTLKPNAAYYVEVNDVNGVTDLDNFATVGKIVRRDYWYPDRGDNYPYADIHENSFTAHIGMAENATGKSAVSVMLDDMKSASGLTVNFDSWGAFTPSADSALGVRIDYCREDGSYAAGKLYALGEYKNNLVTPFGSKAEATEVVSMGGMKGSYDISFADAPSDWNGRITVTYLIKDAGTGATAKFVLRRTAN